MLVFVNNFQFCRDLSVLFVFSVIKLRKSALFYESFVHNVHIT